MIHKIGSLGTNGGPLLVDRVLANSITVAISDSVKTASGFAALGTTGARVLGHVESLIGPDGLTPVKDGTLLQNLGATYVTSASNQTVALVRARVDIDMNSLYSSEVTGVLGTTTGSNLAGYTMDLSDEDTLLETSAIQTTGQYYSHGLDRNKTTQVMTNILESEVFGF